MDHILQRVVEASRMSLLDGYSRYNQILVHEDDRDKTMFTTPWGTFHYAKMPFRLKNAGATFQRAMDITFANEKDVFLVVYLDDLKVFSNSDEEHLYHLKIVFQRCRKYGISLNPKKSLFAMDEGKILGHIISKEGIRIDPAHVEAIQKIDFPQSKKEIQYFNGKMNFLRCFVPNLAEHLREIKNMLKKDGVVRWTEESIKYFNLVKLALSSALVLISPDYTQDFILFSFASDHTMVAVLMQKRDQLEKPIAFFSRTIRDAALKYNIIEKQALALVNALKDFQVYILHYHILTYVPNAVVKGVLVQTDLEGRRGKWIAALLEYDVEIKPTKLIKGKGLAKLMAESNLHALDINLIVVMFEENEESLPAQYKIVASCHECQIFQGKRKLQPLPLKPIEVSAPFQQWGLDFIGEIHPSSLVQPKWILTATDYFTKWIEAIPTRQATDSIIISFLENNILSHFGCPNKLITNNAAAFKSKRMIDFCHKYQITLRHSSAYYPQGNGLAEYSNKALVNIMKKLLETNKKSWHKKLVNALWADRVSQKKSIGMSPFELVYGVDTVFLTSLAVPVVKLLQEAGNEDDHMQL
eukprot:PITA_24455